MILSILRRYTSLFFLSLILATTVVPASIAQAQETMPEFLSARYDGGPDFLTEMGEELIRIKAKFPHFSGIAVMMIGEDKFRPAFGAILERMISEPNSVVIMVKGQDGTHFAEWNGDPGIAAFGNVVNGVVEHSGVRSEFVSFNNGFGATIKGQYAVAATPVFKVDAQGKPVKVFYRGYVTNELWMLSMDLRSPIVQARNRLDSWIIRNNPKSLKCVMLLGTASKDAFSMFIEAHGGQVATKVFPGELNSYRMPKVKIVSAGGNQEAAMLLDRNGQDIFAKVLGVDAINYKVPEKKPKGFVSQAETAQKALAEKENLEKWFGEVDFQQGGLGGSGLLHPAQIGGFDIENGFVINGKHTHSLKGLVVDGYTIPNDIAVVGLVHPTRMMMMPKTQVPGEVAKSLKPLRDMLLDGRIVIPEEYAGLTNHLLDGTPYALTYADHAAVTLPFGTAESMVGKGSKAIRKGANVIIAGSKDKKAFFNPGSPYDQSKLIKKMMEALPASYPPENELWTFIPSGPETMYVFDRGPFPEYAQLMKENIPVALTQKFPVHKDFAYHRGNPYGVKVLYVSDRHGYTDIRTRRVMTGARGQIVEGMFRDLGISNVFYLTPAPFDKKPGDAKGWAEIMEGTKTFREKLFAQIVAQNDLQFIVADGADSIAEVNRILGPSGNVKIINVNRKTIVASSGLKELGAQIQKLPGFESKKLTYKPANINRAHLPDIMKWWDGTSGERVIRSIDPNYPDAFAIVVPSWATNQDYKMPEETMNGIQEMVTGLATNRASNIAVEIRECDLIMEGIRAEERLLQQQQEQLLDQNTPESL